MLPMKTEQIIYLSDIAKTNSITQTAQSFFISQQALSTTIKKLEEEFNATFLKRTNKGVVLTEAGEYFLERSKGILDTYFSDEGRFAFCGLDSTAGSFDRRNPYFLPCADFGNFAD